MTACPGEPIVSPAERQHHDTTITGTPGFRCKQQSQLAGVGGANDDIYTSAITGARLGAHITPSNWINVSFGRGSFLFDDGYAQVGGSVWELETSLAHTVCSRRENFDLCAVPLVGVGYQSGWAEFADGLVMDDPWTERTSRPFAAARLGGRAIIGGHLGLELALGARVTPSVWESGGLVVGMSATAGIDASF